MKAAPVDINWNPNLSIYASEAFLKTAGDQYGWIGGIDAGGKLRCILPYTIQRKAFVKMARFRTETINLGEPLRLDEEREFLNQVIKHFRSIGADLIIPGTTNAIFRSSPDGAVVAPYGTQIIDLTQSETTLWENVHSKHRNVIRNAMKKGIQIKTGHEYRRQAFDLISETLKRSKLGFLAYASFERMVLELGEQIKIFVAEYEGAVQGCAVIPYSLDTAYYLYGGTVAEPLTGAGNYLQWEAIRSFQKLGVRKYDFCGVRINPDKDSKAAGLMMYKERFGPQLIQGFMWKYSINPIKAGIYSIGVRLLRGGDIVDVEQKRINKIGRPILVQKPREA
jgi:hypothetical protein